MTLTKSLVVACTAIVLSLGALSAPASARMGYHHMMHKKMMMMHHKKMMMHHHMMHKKMM